MVDAAPRSPRQVGMVRDGAAYLLVRAINGLLALAALALLTRLLEPDQYGRFALGMAAMTFLATVLFQWVNVALARFHGAHLPADDAVIAVAHHLVVRVALAFVLALSAWATLKSATEPSLTSILAVGLSAVALGLHNLHLQITNARLQPRRYGLITASRSVLALGMAIALIAAGAGATGAIAAVGIACLLSVALFGARWLDNLPADRRMLRRQFVVFGLPMALASLSTMVLDLSDRFLIGLWQGSAKVAGYAAAYDLTQQSVGVVLNVFFIAAYPRIVAAWEADGVSGARVSLVSLGRVLLLVAPLAVGFFAGLAPEIAALMFGPGIRADAVTVMPWIALAIAIGCVKAYLLDVAFHLFKSTATLLKIAAAMAVLNVALNLVLIPMLGVLGAALSVLAAFLVGAILSWLAGRSVGVYPRLTRELPKAAAAAVAMVVVLRADIPDVLPVPGGDAVSAMFRLLAGVASFAVIAWLVDLSQLRSALSKRAWSVLN